MKAKEIADCLESFLTAELRRTCRFVQSGDHANPDRAVHEARKSIKKLRATLRFARKMVPQHKLRPLAKALRSAAHTLGPLRDSLVLNETGRALTKRGEKAPPKSEAPHAVPILKLTQTHLRRATVSLSRLLGAGFYSTGANAALRRLNKRARNAMKKARKSGSDADLHAWRRRTKDLLYVLEVIKVRRGALKKLKLLAELLGDGHDLATFIANHHSNTGQETHSYLLLRARKRRGPLQQKAFKLGAKLSN